MGCYAIGIGGTGARGIEALVHLCAAGLGPDSLFVLIVDPDQANGNVDRAVQIISRYKYCRDMFRQTMGERGTNLFKTDLLFAKRANQPVLTWSPTFSEKTLSDYFRLHIQDPKLRDMASLLYTRAELAMNLEWGFRGHCSVGAPVMARIERMLEEQPWSDLLAAMKRDVGAGLDASVFTFASIFGATGASGFPTIGRILHDRKSSLGGSPERMKMGGVLFLPYFTFNPPTDDEQARRELSAKAEHFLINARAALSHYAFEWSKDENAPYDAIYLVGERRSDGQGRKFALGGSNQANPAHYVELLSGLAARDFYLHRAGAAEGQLDQEKRKLYAGRAGENVVLWTDMPDFEQRRLKDKLLYFASTAAAFLGFYYPLISGPEFESHSELSPWYSKNFAPNSLTNAAERDRLKVLRDYFVFLSQWCSEIHNYAGTREIEMLDKNRLNHGVARSCQFDADDFGHMMFTGDHKTKFPHAYQELMSIMGKTPVQGIDSPTGKFLDLLYRSASQFCVANYRMR